VPEFASNDIIFGRESDIPSYPTLFLVLDPTCCISKYTITVDFLADRHLERFWATKTGKGPLPFVTKTFDQHLQKTSYEQNCADSTSYSAQ
jgi:hypothetical protein